MSKVESKSSREQNECYQSTMDDMAFALVSTYTSIVGRYFLSLHSCMSI